MNNPDPKHITPRSNPKPERPKKETPVDASERESETSPDEVGKLSAEEQLARYEESLKNDDWGHQPC